MSKALWEVQANQITIDYGKDTES